MEALLLETENSMRDYHCREINLNKLKFVLFIFNVLLKFEIDVKAEEVEFIQTGVLCKVEGNEDIT